MHGTYKKTSILGIRLTF